MAEIQTIARQKKEIPHSDEPPKPIKEFMSMMFQSGPFPPQILEKITDRHIDKALEISEKAQANQIIENKSIRRYMFLTLIVGVLGFSFLVYYLRDDTNLLISLVGILLSFIGGFGAGYGYCRYKI